jgi:hypothetical protein
VPPAPAAPAPGKPKPLAKAKRATAAQPPAPSRLYTDAELAAALAQARRDALEEAAKWHDEQAAYCDQRAKERLSDGWPEATAVLKTTQAAHLHSAAAIRAKAQEAGDE